MGHSNGLLVVNKTITLLKYINFTDMQLTQVTNASHLKVLDYLMRITCLASVTFFLFSFFDEVFSPTPTVLYVCDLATVIGTDHSESQKAINPNMDA